MPNVSRMALARAEAEAFAEAWPPESKTRGTNKQASSSTIVKSSTVKVEQSLSTTNDAIIRILANVETAEATLQLTRLEEIKRTLKGD
jgi:hypothetical protein